MRKLVFAIASVAAALAPPVLAQTAQRGAASYPNKSIRLVVPSAPGYAFDVWYGLVFPGGTPGAIVKKTNAEVVNQLKSPEVGGRFARAGVEPATYTPEAFAELIRREVATWSKVVKAANIKVE